MASAAQIAARKKFAAIMKSGGFGKKRKKNPVKEVSGAALNRLRDKTRKSRAAAAEKRGDGSTAWAIQQAAPRKRKKNPASAPPAGTTKRQTLNRAASRRRNPVESKHSMPSGYHVHVVDRHGEAGTKLATFVEKGPAVEYARGYAHKHNKQLCILGKK